MALTSTNRRKDGNPVTIGKDYVKSLVNAVYHKGKGHFLGDVQLFQKHPPGEILGYFDRYGLPEFGARDEAFKAAIDPYFHLQKPSASFCKTSFKLQ
ncbi:hypothetical protein PTH_2625 [Pelotomaculum thermopropionicum SI]|uniref:Uncharacterized protein n=1 Tax=Pelotomaculum thermopropionicum (strain DSM 13744 / JCM 10971 / SI) TaxID=370438 RepID=A5CYW0_PELTS|nr:hypothetical protein PTH_2625 [Pelotomaculum thermopropionicum SI]